MHVFCKKHGFSCDSDSLTDRNGDIGRTAFLDECELVVNMDDIRYDIDHDISKEQFIRWYDKHTELALYDIQYLNYPAYCRNEGADQWTDERMQELRDSQQRIEQLKEEFLKKIQEYNQEQSQDTPTKTDEVIQTALQRMETTSCIAQEKNTTRAE